jgi:uncharacterized protein (TIGR01655 family)
LVSWDEKLVSKKLREAFCRRKIFKMTKMLGVFSRFQWLDFQNFCIVALEIKKEQSVMKKFLIGLVSLIVIAFVGLQIADKVVKSGDEYFVQITTDGQRVEEKDDSGNNYVDYKYSLPGYDKDGNKKELDFNANKDRPLRREAFLKVTWNKKKGVTSYEEVQQKDLPKKAADKLGV